MSNNNWNLNAPYFYETLTSVVSKPVVVQTERSSVLGTFAKIMPDLS